jgi:hypothetical protein
MLAEVNRGKPVRSITTAGNTRPIGFSHAGVAGISARTFFWKRRKTPFFIILERKLERKFESERKFDSERKFESLPKKNFL